MMSRSGLTHVITMDLHQKEVQGFFDCPVDNLRASPFLLQYIQECVSTYKTFQFQFNVPIKYDWQNISGLTSATVFLADSLFLIFPHLF